MQTDSSSPVAASGNIDAAEQLNDALNHHEVVKPAAPLRESAAIPAQCEQQPDIPADPFASDHVCQLLPSDLVRIAFPCQTTGMKDLAACALRRNPCTSDCHCCILTQLSMHRASLTLTARGPGTSPLQRIPTARSVSFYTHDNCGSLCTAGVSNRDSGERY